MSNIALSFDNINIPIAHSEKIHTYFGGTHSLVLYSNLWTGFSSKQPIDWTNLEIGTDRSIQTPNWDDYENNLFPNHYNTVDHKTISGSHGPPHV